VIKYEEIDVGVGYSGDISNIVEYNLFVGVGC